MCFKIYGLYFLQQAMCVFSMPETGRNRCRVRETNRALVATHGFLGEFETDTFAVIFHKQNLCFFKSLFFKGLKRRKIQGTYFKISALYFKIYGLYFLQDALCFLERPERGEKHGVILENKKALTLLNIFSVFFLGGNT